MNLKEQRDKLLELLKCWTGGYGNALTVSKSWLHRDSQKLIREIYEQIEEESRSNKCKICWEYKNKKWKQCANPYCKSLLIKKKGI